MDTYLPVSISKGRIPALNYDIRERNGVLLSYIHLIIYVSGSNTSLNIMYVLSLGVFFYSYFPFVTQCFVSICMHTIYTVKNNLKYFYSNYHLLCCNPQ